jgi:hypothetical protein
MSDERLIRLLTLLASADASESATLRLCQVSTLVSDATGAGITLMSSESQMAALRTTSDLAGEIESLQFALGEGPCIDAFRTGMPVLEPDLIDTKRWFAFSARIVSRGVRAMFSFPLQAGDARLGSLFLYRNQPGMLSGDEYSDALMLADMAVPHVLAAQDTAWTQDEPIDPLLGAEFHALVHQSAGMISEQLGIPVSEAFVRLRGYAFSHDMHIKEVAEAIVTRRFRLES